MPYVVSEFLEGQTLRELLTVGPFTLRKTLDIARQIASGLAAHARGSCIATSSPRTSS